jgi:hypothetical protein
MSIKQKIISVLLAIVALLGGSYGVTTLGSINDGQSYNSIVTATGETANKDLIKLGSGTLGSVVITGAAAGTFEIYDATTTNASLRTITATSSLRKLASFPANAAAGTYVFDVNFNQGMIVAFTSTQGTTTITYR